MTKHSFKHDQYFDNRKGYSEFLIFIVPNAAPSLPSIKKTVPAI